MEHRIQCLLICGLGEIYIMHDNEYSEVSEHVTENEPRYMVIRGMCLCVEGDIIVLRSMRYICV